MVFGRLLSRPFGKRRAFSGRARRPQWRRSAPVGSRACNAKVINADIGRLSVRTVTRLAFCELFLPSKDSSPRDLREVRKRPVFAIPTDHRSKSLRLMDIVHFNLVKFLASQEMREQWAGHLIYLNHLGKSFRWNFIRPYLPRKRN